MAKNNIHRGDTEYILSQFMSAFFPFQWLFFHNIDKLKKQILINLIYMKEFI